MSARPIAILKTTPRSTRMLVQLHADDVLKAVLPMPSSPPHPRALPTLFEALALWHQTPLHVVLSAADADAWCRLGLLDELWVAVDSVHYTVDLRFPDQERRQRITGLGEFRDLRQLALGVVP